MEIWAAMFETKGKKKRPSGRWEIMWVNLIWVVCAKALAHSENSDTAYNM